MSCQIIQVSVRSVISIPTMLVKRGGQKKLTRIARNVLRRSVMSNILWQFIEQREIDIDEGLCYLCRAEDSYENCQGLCGDCHEEQEVEDE